MESWDLASIDVEPHNPKILRTDEEARAIAINLPKGEELSEHQTHERGWLIVADGLVGVGTNGGGEAGSGGPGFVVHFEPNERREVVALEDSRLLLILAPWPGEGHPSQQHN
jgi:quercetin dioxygenase-like cupin family protein